MAAKRLVVLNQSSDGIMQNYTVAFWFPITANPRPQASGSVWNTSGTSTGASAAENSAIQAGTVQEETRGFVFPVGLTTTAIQAYLIQYWTNRNTQIAGIGGNQYYGTSFDGTTWGTS